MKEFKIRRDEYGYENFYITDILSNGQSIKIEFEAEDTNNYRYYSIALLIQDKKKQLKNFTHLKQTGRCGIEGLIWAKNKIAEFEKMILIENENYCYNNTIIIYCEWDDNRRRNTYERGLKSLGYTFGKAFGKKVLMKKIN